MEPPILELGEECLVTPNVNVGDAKDFLNPRLIEECLQQYNGVPLKAIYLSHADWPKPILVCTVLADDPTHLRATWHRVRESVKNCPWCYRMLEHFREHGMLRIALMF